LGLFHNLSASSAPVQAYIQVKRKLLPVGETKIESKTWILSLEPIQNIFHDLGQKTFCVSNPASINKNNVTSSPSKGCLSSLIN